MKIEGTVFGEGRAYESCWCLWNGQLNFLGGMEYQRAGSVQVAIGQVLPPVGPDRYRVP